MVVVAAAVGDCRHHHRHHRSVYKKNFFPTTFCVGMGSWEFLSLSLSLSLTLQNYQKHFVSFIFVLNVANIYITHK